MLDSRECIDALLDKVPLWRDESPVAAPLSGGITNQNFRVDAGGATYVLRVLSKTTDHLGIDREHEHACSRIAAELGIGPAVEYFSLEDGVLVVRFVEAAALTPESARAPDTMARIVETMKRYHDGPAFPGAFSPFETVRSYRRRAADRGVRFPDSLAQAIEVMERIESALARVRRLAPCHNDLLAGNFLDDGAKIWIIDWEYGGMGDPFFDLGNFSVNQELDADGVEHLVACYCGGVTARDLAHVRLMELASDLRESLWGYLQSGVSELDFDYVEYGSKHLERFLARAATPELARWLGDVA